MSKFFVEQVARLAESGEPVTVELVTSAGGIMTGKNLYEDIRGKRSRRDQTMLEVMALFDEQKDETNDWQRKAEEMEAARDRVLELLEKAADDSGIPNEAGGFTLAADIVRREMGGK